MDRQRSITSSLHPLFFFFLLFYSVHDLTAQMVSEWELVWSTPPDPTNETPVFIDDLGPGNFLVGTRSTAMVTWNGGRDWREVYSFLSTVTVGPRRIVDGAFIDKGTYLIVIDSTINLPNGWRYRSTLLRTENGGGTWEVVSLPEDSYVRDLMMLDNRSGAISATSEGERLLYYTTDGGKVWSPRAIPGDFSAWSIDLRSDSVWGIVGHDTALHTQFFFRSTDAGATWHRSVDSIPDTRDVVYIGDSKVIAVGGRQIDKKAWRYDLIRKSDDGGRTWRTIMDTLHDEPFGLFAVDFSDDLNGIVVGGGTRILRTTDGGESWRRESAPSALLQQYEFLTDVAYPAEDKGMVTGERYGVIAMTGRTELMAPIIVRPDTNLGNHPLATTIAWEPIAGATSYQVQIGDTAYDYNFVAPEVFGNPWLDSSGIMDTSLSVTLEPHIRYSIRVRAQSDQAGGAWSRHVSLRTEGEGTVLAMPQFLYPKYQERNVPLGSTFSWTSVENAVGYDLTIGTDPQYLFNPIHYDHVQDTSQVVSGLESNTSYWASIRARDADGVTSEWREVLFSTEDILSVDEPPLAGGVTIHPNVASDRMSLSLPVAWSGYVGLQVLTSDGRKVLDRSLSLSDRQERVHAIDCSTLPPGSYYVAVSHNGDRYLLPVLVVR